MEPGYGKILTQLFYAEMLKNHPDLVKIEGSLGGDLSVPYFIFHSCYDLMKQKMIKLEFITMALDNLE